MINPISAFRSITVVNKQKLVVCWLCVVVIGLGFLFFAVAQLRTDLETKEEHWNKMFTNDQIPPEYAALAEKATVVTTGTYVENVKKIDLKANSFDVEFNVWFRWQGRDDLDMQNNFRVYNGNITKQTLVREYSENGKNYQLVRVAATVNTKYYSRAFPLERLQLRFYIEPSYTISEVRLQADTEYSGLNPSLSLSGFKVVRNGVGNFISTYPNTRNDPVFEHPVCSSEIVTAVEVARDSLGLYAKCFIALFGTTLWVLITLYLNTYHRVDPLSMVPAALFGTVSNIMVGANLLPDALDMGLLEYVNIWGIMTILGVTFSIITVNQIRRKHEDTKDAQTFGRIMFATIITLVLVGHVALPLACLLPVK